MTNTQNTRKPPYTVGSVFYGRTWNRREEGRVLAALRQAEEAKRAKELRAERLATFHWIKEAGEWVVAGDFEGKSEGDDIIVMKASGEKQEKRIVGFTCSGNAYVK